MSAIFNFLGVFIMTHINASVASTISNMVDFGSNTQIALIALCAALFSIVVYSVGASVFGIPTSESHSLIAGLTGAAIALNTQIALIALCAALFSIVVYSVGASVFGIPTSESHSLIAGLTGAAIALGGADGVNMNEWVKVLYGLVLSLGLGTGACARRTGMWYQWTYPSPISLRKSFTIKYLP